MEEIFLILIGIAWAIGTPIIAIVALARTSGLRDQNARLISEVAQLRRQIGQIGQGEALPPPFVAEPAAEAVPVPPPAPPFEMTPPEVVAEAPLAPAPAAVAPVEGGWEQRLGARAFLWVGAVTLALAAIFLVRYSIEEGYLSPEVRVILAALFGFALIAGAERIRARDDRVAQALAAAGVAALYGSLFSAVALYDMISRVAAGGGAAALTAFAIGVSLRHGIFVAALAFVGGFASPAIIGSETPNTPVLFGYLLAIAAGTLGVLRVRGWWPLGWGVLAGSAIWTGIWMLSRHDARRGALGRPLPGGGRRPLRLGDVAADGREREPAGRRRGPRLGGARRHRRAAGRRDRRGRRPAERRLAGARAAWRRRLRARPLDAALPVCGSARAGPVARGACLVVGHDVTAARPGMPIASPGSRSFSAASMPPAPLR